MEKISNFVKNNKKTLIAIGGLAVIGYFGAKKYGCGGMFNSSSKPTLYDQLGK
jgi:hypothetical protein